VPTAAGPHAVRGLFAREGEYWTLACGDQLTRLADSKGLRQIAHLLRNPGQQVHALDLMALSDSPSTPTQLISRSEMSDLSLRAIAQNDTGEVLDAQARSAYSLRLKELHEELEEARERGFEARALAAETEIDALAAHLQTSLGVGGRARRSGSAAERARLAVGKSIGRAVESIAAANSELGHLLETTIKTGTFCSYQPDPRFPVEWRFDEAEPSPISDTRNGTSRTEVLPVATNGAGSITGPPIQVKPASPRITRQMVTIGAAIGVLAIAITAAIAYRVRMKDTRRMQVATDATSRSIAVLPFANRSASKDDEYFSDGMTDEIIGQLTKIGKLQVVARTSSFAFKGQNQDAKKIADSLGVRTLLEGSVRRSAGKVRIEVELIDARSGFTIWSERYDRATADVFEIQGEVAENVADKLQVMLLPKERTRMERKPTANLEAYNLYLQGIYYLNQNSEAGADKGAECFRRAIQKDPKFALAYALLGLAYGFNSDLNVAPREATPKVRALEERALAMDPGLGVAHTTLAGLVLWQYDWDWTGAEKEFKRALEVNPGASFAHGLYGQFLSVMGRYEEAAREAETAQQLDPVQPQRAIDVGEVYRNWRRCDRAMEYYQQAIDMAPEFYGGYMGRGFGLLCKAAAATVPGFKEWKMPEDAVSLKARADGNPASRKEASAAIPDFEKAVALSDFPWTEAMLGLGYAAAGRRAEAMGVLAKLQEWSKHRYVPAWAFLLIYRTLGDADETFRWLDIAYRDRSNALWELKRDISWDPYRSDPRFIAMLKKVGLDK
jgi:TolB-like protein/Tfp pilus assembly protein PilF